MSFRHVYACAYVAQLARGLPLNTFPLRSVLSLRNIVIHHENNYDVITNIQDGREISVIIVSEDYLCYKEPKSPYKCFLILIFYELFKFKTSDEWQH